MKLGQQPVHKLPPLVPPVAHLSLHSLHRPAYRVPDPCVRVAIHQRVVEIKHEQCRLSHSLICHAHLLIACARCNVFRFCASVPVIINPRCACAARVTVVVLCVCLSVCLSTTILGLQATRRLMSDTNIFSATRVRNTNWRFC